MTLTQEEINDVVSQLSKMDLEQIALTICTLIETVRKLERANDDKQWEISKRA